MAFGSLHNKLMADGRSPAPEVGMGATILMWSDRHAATIVAVERGGKRVGIKQDNAKLLSGSVFREAQKYEFSPNPDARVEWYSLRKNGRFVREGESQSGGRALGIGYRSEYYDPSF